MSAFSRWFERQHGPRQTIDADDDELEKAIEAGERARIELQKRQLWDAGRTSALYAWQVPDEDKPRYARGVAEIALGEVGA